MNIWVHFHQEKSTNIFVKKNIFVQISLNIFKYPKICPSLWTVYNESFGKKDFFLLL